MKTIKEENSQTEETIVRIRASVKDDYPRFRIKLKAQGHRIDWGDGKEDKRKTHDYEKGGNYEICIRAKSIDCLDFNWTRIEELDLSRAKGLKKLLCHFNDLTELDLTGCEDIEEVDCGHNKLKKLIVGERLNLKRLECSENELQQLNLDGCKSLKYLDCHSNKLTDLSFKDCPDLRYVHCKGNNLELPVLDGMAAILPRIEAPENAHIAICDNPGYEDCQIVHLNHRGWNVEDPRYGYLF